MQSVATVEQRVPEPDSDRQRIGRDLRPERPGVVRRLVDLADAQRSSPGVSSRPASSAGERLAELRCGRAIESSAASTTASRGSWRTPAWCAPSNGIRSASRSRAGTASARRRVRGDHGLAGRDRAERERASGEEAAAIELHGRSSGIAGGYCVSSACGTRARSSSPAPRRPLSRCCSVRDSASSGGQSPPWARRIASSSRRRPSSAALDRRQRSAFGQQRPQRRSITA